MQVRRGVAAPLWLSLLPLLLAPSNAIDCTNVTIADADDAADVRSSCTIITGNLGFAKALSVDINLDGLTEVQGDITHTGCEESWDDCDIPDAFSISSSTLATVGGAIDFWYFQGLEELSFPSLTRVQGSVSLKRLHQLKTLDITKLARLGYFTLEAQNLTTLNHEGLEGFTGENKYGAVAFWAAAVTSVDSFFNHPIEANGTADQSGVTISTEYMPNLDRLNFAWARVPRLWVSGDGINVTLGNSRVDSMDIDSLVLKGNITDLNRHSNLDNLTVGSFIMEADNAVEELELPFDSLSGLSVSRSDNLETIKLPRAALSWDQFDLEISSCTKLNLASQFDGDDQVWYWPEKNISKIVITGVNVTNDFFDTWMDYHANGNNSLKVLNEFTITPSSIQSTAFNCTPFDELRSRGVLPSNYNCNNVTESAASSLALPQGWHYGVASAAIAFYLM